MPGQKTGASVLGLGSLDLRSLDLREISGSVVFWEWEGVRSRFSRDHKARIIPRSLNLRVIEFEIDAWL